jgi:hypothetical protein
VGGLYWLYTVQAYGSTTYLVIAIAIMIGQHWPTSGLTGRLPLAYINTDWSACTGLQQLYWPACIQVVLHYLFSVQIIMTSIGFSSEYTVYCANELYVLYSIWPKIPVLYNMHKHYNTPACVVYIPCICDILVLCK